MIKGEKKELSIDQLKELKQRFCRLPEDHDEKRKRLSFEVNRIKKDSSQLQEDPDDHSNSDPNLKLSTAEFRWETIKDRRSENQIFLKKDINFLDLISKCNSMSEQAAKSPSSTKDGMIDSLLKECNSLKTIWESEGYLESFRVLMIIVIANSYMVKDDSSLFNNTNVSNIIANVAGKFILFIS